jgi:hypothetical protein
VGCMLAVEGPQASNAAAETSTDGPDRVRFTGLDLSGEHADAAAQINAVWLTVIASNGGGTVITSDRKKPRGIAQYGFWRCVHG